MKYIIELDSRGEEVIIGIDGDLRLSIPKDPANSDYQAYLNPVEHLTEIPPQAALSTPNV